MIFLLFITQQVAEIKCLKTMKNGFRMQLCLFNLTVNYLTQAGLTDAKAVLVLVVGKFLVLIVKKVINMFFCVFIF